MAERSHPPGPELRTGTGPEPEPVSVPVAARALGISERAVRKRIAAGTLRAEPFGRSYRVWLPEEVPPPGPEPGPARGPEHGPEPIEAQFRARAVTVSPAAYAQLEAIRDQWLAPLVAQITEQAERIGRLEAERDAARAAESEARRWAEIVGMERDQLRAAIAQDASHAAPGDTSEAQGHEHDVGHLRPLGRLQRLWRVIRGE